MNPILYWAINLAIGAILAYLAIELGKGRGRKQERNRVVDMIHLTMARIPYVQEDPRYADTKPTYTHTVLQWLRYKVECVDSVSDEERPPQEGKGSRYV